MDQLEELNSLEKQRVLEFIKEAKQIYRNMKANISFDDWLQLLTQSLHEISLQRNNKS